MKRMLVFSLFVWIALVVAGCSATNDVELIAPDAYTNQFTEVGTDHILIDVRTPSEFNSGHIPGAINIPVDQIASRLSEIPSDMPIVVYCQSGNRSGRAAGILSQNDYSQLYDLGGISRWISSGYPVQ